MKVYRVFHLRPLGAFHLGERGIGLEESATFAHSDTVYSALCFAWAEAFGREALERLLEAWERREPPFIVSSAFPYVRGVRFYPRPLLQPPAGEEARQQLKGVRWVSEGVLFRWVRGEASGDDVGIVVEGELWASREEAARRLLNGGGWRRWYVARVALDRVTAASNLYYVGQVSFAQDCGLFLIAAAGEEGPLDRLRQALEALGEMGLGGERSLGLGRFRVEGEGEWQPPAVAGGAFLTLSLYWPREEEIGAGVLGEGARYRLLRREGWIASPAWPGKRRKWVQMIQEGSLLRGDSGTIYGGAADVTPAESLPGAHRVLRVGYAFPIPVAAFDDGG